MPFEGQLVLVIVSWWVVIDERADRGVLSSCESTGNNLGTIGASEVYFGLESIPYVLLTMVDASAVIVNSDRGKDDKIRFQQKELCIHDGTARSNIQKGIHHYRPN